ncbi:MAG: BrnT family toxin [Acidobacteriota bacterium]|nr:BrnT family toxin [Acidobacteriota bacterium]
MYNILMKFVWKESKRELVIKKRGIDLAKITDLFDDPFAVYFEDYEHSTDEETRFEVIGQSAFYGLLHVIFSYADENDIFLVTARRAENWMVKEYEENRKRL